LEEVGGCLVSHCFSGGWGVGSRRVGEEAEASPNTVQYRRITAIEYWNRVVTVLQAK